MCNVNEDSIVCEEENDEEPKKCVPTQTQVREQLGSRLSNVFFESLCDEAKAWLGLSPPLVGADPLWISPQGRLDGKVVNTPVPEPSVVHLKAFTHQSILDVGEKYIQKLENKHRLEMEEALKKEREELEYKIRGELIKKDSNENSESEQTKKVVITLLEHFDRCFEELVETTHLQMRKECQLRVDNERAEIAAYMLTQVQEEVEKRDYILCNDFHDILFNELNVLASRYVKQIDEEREIAIELLRETVDKYEKMLTSLRTEFELNSVVDICRAIALERIDCNERIKKVRNESRQYQDVLLSIINDLKAENSTLKQMSTERLKRLLNWRKKLHIVLEEFQRFINFSLKAVPGQAEFLLSIEKLMFKDFPQDAFIQPEDYLSYKKCLECKSKPSEENETMPLIYEPSESSKSYGRGEGGESLSFDEVCCPTFQIEKKKECDLNFDYDKFKSMLISRFASDKKKPHKRRYKKTVCVWKDRPKEVVISKSNEWYKKLNLVGETEKEHLGSVDSFLKNRLKTVLNICNDDPEFAKIMLGCPRI